MSKGTELQRMAITYKNQLLAFQEDYYRGELDGYCPHGVYVGGCGIDYMCGVCEDGRTIYEIALNCAKEELRKRKKLAKQELFNSCTQWLIDNAELFNKDERHKLVVAMLELSR